MNVNSSNRPDNPGNAATGAVVFDIRKLSDEQFGKLGMAQVAYVKAVVIDGMPGFAIHAADGTPMAVAEDREVAVAAILQHEMFPLSVH